MKRCFFHNFQCSGRYQKYRFKRIKSAISSKISSIVDTIKNGFNSAKNFITNLASDAWNWGADIISGIVNGIKSMIGNMADAVTGVADTIRSYLHFSVPDEGPLTDFESWMPDFMKGLASGIQKSKKLVESAVNNVAESMKLSLNSDLNCNLNGVSGAIIDGKSSGAVVNNYYNDDPFPLEIYSNTDNITIQNDGETVAISDEEYTTLLVEKGAENLVPMTETSESTIAADSRQYQYNEDYFVGDYVTVEHDRFSLTQSKIQLVGMIESYDQNGIAGFPHEKFTKICYN